MNSWRVTKYNPTKRNDKGYYQDEEWTAYSDINKIYNAKEFTLSNYLEVENNYTKAIKVFMEESEVSCFKIVDVEKSDINSILEDPYSTPSMIEIFRSVEEKEIIKESKVFDLCKLILRGYLWGKLSNSKMFVHFGYDYYMYIGLEKNDFNRFNDIENLGLFIEELDSPYN
ncbi:hypothetical protein ACFSGI_21335 [Paenibacillus nicotianae]|uniref:Uncharacterized protein n=1 Tax=Paenibacillus nicotianae TaxID=1526551 RepID=A0ABW4V2C7_9BACL